MCLSIEYATLRTGTPSQSVRLEENSRSEVSFKLRDSNKKKLYCILPHHWHHSGLIRLQL